MRAKVGAMPQPKSNQPHHEQGGGSSKVRVQSGMSLEDLKRQTAYRLAAEGSDESSETNVVGVDGSEQQHQHQQQQQTNTIMHYQQSHQHHAQSHAYPREPLGASPQYGGPMSPPSMSMPYPQQRGGPMMVGYDASSSAAAAAAAAAASSVGPANNNANNYGESTPRNYTDSQLGVAGAAAGQGSMPQVGSSPAAQKNYYRPQPLQQQQQQQPQPQQQQQYSTPRMPRHATVLKDRGSAENTSVGSDPSGGSDSLGYGYGGVGSSSSRGNNHPKGGASSLSSPAMKGRTGSHGKNLNKAPSSARSQQQPKEMRSPEGRHTPVRNRNLEGQVLFATPNERRQLVPPSTPTAPYSEPPVRTRGSNHHRHHHHQNMSPNYNRMRSPDHHQGSSRGGYYQKNNQHQQQQQPNNSNSKHHNNHQQHQHQSKLPHGLTVQELKEMTRARLAAEADAGGPEESSDRSVHSAGTHQSSKGSGGDQYSLGRGGGGSGNLASAQSNESVTRNLVRSNESIRRDYSNQGPNALPYQGQQNQQQQQMQSMQQPPNPPQFNNYPRHPSPVFGPGGPGPNQFNVNQQPPSAPRQTSPAFGLNSSQTRSLGEAWETASSASADPGFHTNNSGGSGTSVNMPFSPPMSDSNAMTFNRGRCFSAGATVGMAGMPTSFDQHQAGTGMLPSFDQHQAAYYEQHVPLTGNRQRCATVSPPGMSRLHEDRPFLFSTDDKARLAIPPLSEPRLRLHSTGGLNTHGTAMRAFASANPRSNRTDVGGGSAFVPIGKPPPTTTTRGNNDDRFSPQRSPPMNLNRSKFGAGDRTISTGSAGHGDLPSSMAEAVLESITSTSGLPIGGSIIAASPYRRSSEQELMLGESPFRVSEDSDNASSAFRMDHGIMPESSGSMSLFSSGESQNIFSTERSGERMLLGTHSWGGAEDDASHSNMGLSHDFSNLLNLSGGNLASSNDAGLPPLRGRAATEPVWFGGNDPLLVSRIDPEHNGEAKGPPRVSSLVDTKSNAPLDFNAYGQPGRNNYDGR